MIKKIVTTAVISTALLMGANNMAQSKEINLECKIGDNPDNKSSIYTIDTELGTMAHDTFGQGRLMVTSTSYSTLLSPDFIGLEVSIDRSTLKYTTSNYIAPDEKTGTCKLIETNNKI